MRMTINQFVTKEVYDINYIIMLLFLADLGVEQHMEQDITQFLGQFMFISIENGSVEFLYFLYGLRTKRLVGLLAVPWAFLSKFIKDIQDASECLKFLFSCMHFRIEYFI